MNSEPDWLEEALDRHPGEPVPEGFAARLRARLDAERPLAPAGGGRLLLWRWLPVAAAAAVFLAVGFWLGRGARPLHRPQVVPGGESLAAADLEDMFQQREVLEDLPLVTDDALDLAFDDGVVALLLGPPAEKEEK